MTPTTVVVTKKNKEDDTDPATTGMDPTVAPTPGRIGVDMALEPLLGSIALLDKNSYEWKAYEWLVHVDESGILEHTSTPAWRIVQRYVAALFFLSTSGSMVRSTFLPAPTNANGKTLFHTKISRMN